MISVRDVSLCTDSITKIIDLIFSPRSLLPLPPNRDLDRPTPDALTGRVGGTLSSISMFNVHW